MRIPEKTRAHALSLVRDADDRRQVGRFLELCEGYADLERAVIGELRYDLPVHNVEARGGDTAALLDEAARLASAAWRLLDRIPPIGDLGRALEEHSARVFEMPLTTSVAGVFVFAGEIAPSFLLNSRLVPGCAHFTLAHLYAHYLVDNDPYEPRACAMPSLEGTEVERRATAFAHELLMPEMLIRPYIDAGASVDVLAETFELPRSIVLERLAMLGIRARGAAEDDRWGADRGVILPERLVRLALEGIHSDALDVADFAAALRLDEREAIALLRLSASAEGEDSSSGSGKPVNGVSSQEESGP